MLHTYPGPVVKNSWTTGLEHEITYRIAGITALFPHGRPAFEFHSGKARITLNYILLCEGSPIRDKRFPRTVSQLNKGECSIKVFTKEILVRWNDICITANGH